MRVGSQYKNRGHPEALAFLLRLCSRRRDRLEADRNVDSGNNGISTTVRSDRLFVDAENVIREILSNGDYVSPKRWFAVEKLRS